MPIRDLPAAGSPPPAPMPRKIAIEEHVLDPGLTGPRFGDSFPPRMAQPGSPYGGFNPGYGKAVAERLGDLRAGRLEEMDAAGIDVAILSQTIGGVEGIPDPAEAVAAARRANDFLAGEIAAGNGRFAGFATLPLQDPAAAVRELRRAVGELGLKGVLANGYSNLGAEKLYLDDPRYEPLWTALEELGLPLYLHPRLPAGAVNDAMYRGHPELAGATWGFAPETATHALRLVYGGVFDRHPGASVILGHLGETLPFFAGRIQRAFEFNPYDRRPRKRLQDFLSDNFWVTTSGNFNDQALITAILTVGADRIMFATDYPYDLATAAARWIERAPISENDRRKICRGNAAGLFWPVGTETGHPEP